MALNNVPQVFQNQSSMLPKSAVRLYKPLPRFGGKIFGRLQAQATWKVDYPDLYTFLNVIGGGASGGFGAVIRTLPMAHPEFNYLLASSIDGDLAGWDQAGTGATLGSSTNNKGWYPVARIGVTFETPPWAITGSDAFVTISGRPSGRNMPVPASAGTLTDGTHPAHDPGVWIPGFTYDVTIHMLPYTNEAYWGSLLRNVNSVPFRGNPAGTVLYTGPSFTTTRTFIGTMTYEVTHSFDVSATNWNYEYGISGQLQEWLPAGLDRFPASDLNVLLNI